VLVVDDNEDVRDVIVAYLDVLGYRALQAASGQDALELLEGGVGTVDLLMADYAMPGMSGTELARAVRGKWPELPVIVITGYADATGFDDQFDQAILLRKPFRINELGTAIEHAVQHSAASASRRRSCPAVARRQLKIRRHARTAIGNRRRVRLRRRQRNCRTPSGLRDRRFVRRG
jgi:CheY-like chemotaxis protein